MGHRLGGEGLCVPVRRGGVEPGCVRWPVRRRVRRWLAAGVRQFPIFEELPIEDGIMLRKYWFSVSDREQAAGSTARSDAALELSRWTWSPSPGGRTTPACRLFAGPSMADRCRHAHPARHRASPRARRSSVVGLASLGAATADDPALEPITDRVPTVPEPGEPRVAPPVPAARPQQQPPAEPAPRFPAGYVAPPPSRATTMTAMTTMTTTTTTTTNTTMTTTMTRSMTTRP